MTAANQIAQNPARHQGLLLPLAPGASAQHPQTGNQDQQGAGLGRQQQQTMYKTHLEEERTELVQRQNQDQPVGRAPQTGIHHSRQQQRQRDEDQQRVQVVDSQRRIRIDEAGGHERQQQRR